MGYAIAIFQSILYPFLVSLYLQVLHYEENLSSVRSWVEKKGRQSISFLSSRQYFPLNRPDLRRDLAPNFGDRGAGKFDPL